MEIKDQIKCVKRELAMRRRSYPKWVAAERMTREQADHEIAAMAAVLETLEALGEPRLFL